jgi:hypothetical protein
MSVIYKDVEVEFDVSDFTDAELMEELSNRGLISSTHDQSSELIDKIFHLRRQGKDYEKELDQYLYQMTGRAI